ncbi:flagellar assembly peptidoglycan hydrolase FlgJ [Chitinilyticum piscinae]|uniref:Peptidoglycan hydrolase FlgJ n=1 Tax=Chitinilyticum piscinae TaxID=2866724 RepID=A0A8J7KGV7_9NEIS|nr:flagellar assembly peptidoglycan hydrolase FlgJ [Chitinilyticum piscinae]MBE9610764.1 flagellar assembly peptidoglycan hydrolase FlgJ [Chitinilyticum piscinae]
MAYTPAVTASVAIDPRGVESLRRQKADVATRGVAQQFESLLLQQMLASMREASPRYADEDQGSSQDLFRSMYDKQLAQTWSAKGGVGLADMILRQLNQQRGVVAGNRASITPHMLRKPENSESSGGLAGVAAKTAVQAVQGAPAPIKAFIDKVGDAATAVARQLNVSPAMLIGHAALESGWGSKSIKDAEGNETWNLFGIKAGKSWGGKTVDVLTTEYVDGAPQKRVEKFRAYGSLDEAFADYASLLQRRYAGVVGAGDDSARFGRALASGGYATAPDYARRVTQVVQSVQSRLAGSSLSA